jgi:hypothetical protein
MNALPALLILATLVSGCATNRSVPLNSSFNMSEVEARLKPGPNSVSGSALIRQVGGGVVTCAGGVVYLMPVTAYAREWASHIYGSDVGGYRPTQAQGIEFSNLNQQFASSVKSTTCNAQGFFNFQDVADGSYYAFTRLNWRVAGDIQGGSIMQSVTVRGGQKAELTLAPQ